MEVFVFTSAVNAGDADPSVSDHPSAILSARSPYLVDAGLGVQEKQLDGGIVLQIGDAFNVEPERRKARGETYGQTKAEHENVLIT